ncbi:hypothetical protein U1Q18_001654 [Sarracenia purpurea var. burkii]
MFKVFLKDSTENWSEHETVKELVRLIRDVVREIQQRFVKEKDPVVKEENVVGFDKKAETLVKRLKGAMSLLEIISIIGMGDLEEDVSEGKLPPELEVFGKRITKELCELPLAIVMIAGLLMKKEKTYEWWEKVAKSMGRSKFVVRFASEPRILFQRPIIFQETVVEESRKVHDVDFETIGGKWSDRLWM